MLAPTVLMLLAAAPTGVAEPPAPAPVVARADHIAIYVGDVDRSVAFYTRLFAFRDVSIPGNRFRWLRLDGGFELHVGKGVAPAKSPALTEHFAVSVADLAPVIAQLKAMGVRWGDANGVAEKIFTGRGDGLRQIYFQDPDGNWIEVNEHRPGG